MPYFDSVQDPVKTNRDRPEYANTELVRKTRCDWMGSTTDMMTAFGVQLTVVVVLDVADLALVLDVVEVVGVVVVDVVAMMITSTP